MKALLIHHQSAGGGTTERALLTDAMARAGWSVTCLTREEASGEAIDEAGPELIAVAGGDGTVAAVLTAIPDRSVPVAILPTGTANNIARSLGISGAPDRLIATWTIDRLVRFDIGSAEGPWGFRRFAEGVGFGAFAESLRRAPAIDGPAKLRAGREALEEALRESAPLPLEIEIHNNMPLPHDLLFLEALVCPYSGPRLPFASMATPGEGRLHLSWLEARNRQSLARWLTDAGAEAMPVSHRPTREMVVHGGGITMRIDDQSCWLEPGSRVTLRVESEPILVLAPSAAPALAGGDANGPR